MKPLIELARAAGIADTPPSLTITGMTSDSRQVKPGFLFAALKGDKSDGEKFIPQAKQNGALAVLCGRGAPDAGLPALRADNPRRALALMAAAFYGAQPEHIVAITGTDGKTSTADFFRQLMGQKAASVGTLGVLGEGGRELFSGTHTTPDPVALHRMLAEMAGQGVTHVAMEASSHGLDQHRLDGVRLEAAAFTTLGRDHFDYHKTEAAYFAAKARLFSELLPEGKAAVLNCDDASFARLETICKRRGHRIIGFGRSGELKIARLELHPRGQRAELELFGKAHTLEIPLVGAFQAMNILAALGLAFGVGAQLEKMLALIPSLQGVPGRLQEAAVLKRGAVFVDYAHTPLALANILNTLRPHTQGKLSVVFGCGGDRDPGKRPEMGKIACQLADRAIVTDDNPRTEDPALIRRAILAACPRAKEIADRKRAIYAALESLDAGDVLVIAGKGHEKTQTVGDTVLPFDDVAVAREAAEELKLT